MGRIVILRKGFMNEDIRYFNVESYNINYDYSDDALELTITTSRHSRTWIFRKDSIDGILYRENKHANTIKNSQIIHVGDME